MIMADLRGNSGWTNPEPSHLQAACCMHARAGARASSPGGVRIHAINCDSGTEAMLELETVVWAARHVDLKHPLEQPSALLRQS